MTKRILVVEDEQPIRDMICMLLEQNGFEPIEASDYHSALKHIITPYPDLILLDWMLPGGSGIQLLKQIKKDNTTKSIPVVMLTAKESEDDRVEGLETGADDYIVKPFSPKELIARIKAVIRRTSHESDEVIEFNELRLEIDSHRVMVAGQLLDIGPTEFKLLHFFMTHPERVFSREQLLDQVWGTNVYVEDRTVDVVIRRLRRALETTGNDKMIQTVRSAGYRFSTRF